MVLEGGLKMIETNKIMPNFVERRSPDHTDGLKRVQVGCGPHNILAEWWNVDIRAFRGIDQVMDVTKPWAWEGMLDYIYGEHFIEHLELSGAISFLQNALQALRPGGKIRLSTPSLEWVLATHFDLDAEADDVKIRQTFATNRAFHGWGHRFLYSRQFLKKIISSVGFGDVQFFSYGESDDSNLANMERHGGFRVDRGFPSVWSVEATRLGKCISGDDKFIEKCQSDYMKYVASGH
ncbi:class I SAM-dependent methyltransferase [Burkholderia territorii]|uniref:class I SAM-dependent methyltransferase n=3 Tax=Burkholderia territorii TaxID=1503055 RepID=UPI002EDB6FCD